MKIKTFLMGLCATSLVALVSCEENTTKSLSELKSEQSDAIEAFRASKGYSFVELEDNKLPSDAKAGVFYRFRNGLYARIDSWGDLSQQATLNKTMVFTQLKGHQFSKGSPQFSLFDNLSNPSIPELEFAYTYFYSSGEVHYRLVENVRPIVDYDDLMCEGIAFPVSLGLGNGAEVSLIIPFELGPSSTYSSGISTYVEKVKYIYK
ncbi:MAG: DUF4827 family protein [Porphyromonas sp.]|nr:DUF4827 family protein [Porphyromonas sp.]